MSNRSTLDNLPDLSRHEKESGVEDQDKHDPLVVSRCGVIAVSSFLIGDTPKVFLVLFRDGVGSVKPAVLVNHV